jgi:hypothetical protein
MRSERKDKVVGWEILNHKDWEVIFKNTMLQGRSEKLGNK